MVFSWDFFRAENRDENGNNLLNSDSNLHRDLTYSGNYGNYKFWTNSTDDMVAGDDFASNLQAATDVSVDAVITSIYFNALAFVVLMASYEVLRRLLPAVYSSRKKRQYKEGTYDQQEEASTASTEFLSEASPRPSLYERTTSLGSLDKALPNVFYMNWVSSVMGVSWETVRKYSGLDGYFFLRFIRMNLRICAVTSFWAFIILVPLYTTGLNQNGEQGWYHISAANLPRGSWRLWVPSVFAYLFSGFIFFVMKQEYRHFLELRMDFLARGNSHVHPQHHYSLLVENIPHELRSEKALVDYFDKLFPGKVHSASVVLNLPDLEAVKARCLRVCRRLEKSIAHCHATNSRPTHNVGSPRINILGIDLAPFDWSCGTYPDVAYVDNQSMSERPARGTHVDSITYYTNDLADMNKDMYFMQQRKTEIALTGNTSFEAENWLSRLMISAHEVADQIMVDSAEDNALRANYASYDDYGASIPQAELMSSRYGSFGPRAGMSPRTAQCRPYAKKLERNESPLEARGKRSNSPGAINENSSGKKSTSSQEKLLVR